MGSFKMLIPISVKPLPQAFSESTGSIPPSESILVIVTGLPPMSQDRRALQKYFLKADRNNEFSPACFPTSTIHQILVLDSQNKGLTLKPPSLGEARPSYDRAARGN